MVRARALSFRDSHAADTDSILTAQRAEAERIFSLLERAFEDDGWPISVLEVDEDRDIHDVSIYVDDSEAEEAGKRMAAALGSDLFGLELKHEPVPDIDWVTHSLEGLAQVRAGRFLVHGSHDMPETIGGQIPILIDAGLAFGTGHHGTTAGCLEMISQVVQERKAAQCAGRWHGQRGVGDCDRQARADSGAGDGY